MAFDPFDDFEATPKDLERFARLLEEDPEANLIQRYDFFKKQDEDGTEQNLGFVPLIIENGFTCIGVPGEGSEKDLAFSVGFFYSLGFPEIMLLGEGKNLDVAKLQPIVQATAFRILDEDEEDDESLSDEKLLDARAHRLAEYVFSAVEEAGLETEGVASPDAAFLDEYPYGYGWYFYRHFTDDVSVPLLLARLK